MDKNVSKHYDRSYFDWQASIGEFGGWANAAKFAGFIRPQDTVLDFGCSGGWLLKNLDCGRRLGIEVIPAAAQVARANGLEVFASTAQAPDHAADVLISNHVLEHTLDPLRELQSLRSKLRPGGKAVFVVPCESVDVAYKPGDVNHHLYSWSPMSLGNLFGEAGYTVIECKPFLHKWPPQYRLIARVGGRRIFDLASRLYARLARSYAQVRLVANVGA
jgi:2-polyprenyl-3-methyl-5-hydroxy-6-metoxy-1,4-benzoquinol methylase